MGDDGVLFISIDDNEQPNLRHELEQILGYSSFVADVCVVNNLKGRNDKEHIATANERLLIYKSPNFQELGFELTDKQKAEYKFRDKDGMPYRLLGLRKRGGNDTRAKRPNLFFLIYANPNDGSVSIERTKDYSIEIIPLKSDGVEGCWRWEKKAIQRRPTELVATKNGKDKWTVFQIDSLFRKGEERRFKPKSVWFGSDYSTDRATKQLRNMLLGTDFKNPKPFEMLESVIAYSSWQEDVILDFFAGSGTTAHAVMNLNRADGGKRKYILVEMGEHFNTVILPRVKKVAFSSKWKDGKAVIQTSEFSKNSEVSTGMSHFAKYFELEQYEDALKKARYEDAPLFAGTQDAYTSYAFLRDLKMLEAVKMDKKKNKVEVNLEKLYDGIDLAETLSCLTGKWIKRITKDSVEFQDGTSASLSAPDWDDVKPLIWW